MTLPDAIRAWVREQFHERYVERVFKDLIDVATGNRDGNNFEREAVRRIMAAREGVRVVEYRHPHGSDVMVCSDEETAWAMARRLVRENYDEVRDEALDDIELDDFLADDDNCNDLVSHWFELTNGNESIDVFETTVEGQ